MKRADTISMRTASSSLLPKLHGMFPFQAEKMESNARKKSSLSVTNRELRTSHGIGQRPDSGSPNLDNQTVFWPSHGAQVLITRQEKIIGLSLQKEASGTGMGGYWGPSKLLLARLIWVRPREDRI